MTDVLSFLGKAVALLNALVAGGIVKSSSGIVIANLLADVQNVVKGAQNPSPDLVGQVQALLNDLKVDGILQGKFIDELDADMAKFHTFASAITAQPIAQPGIGPREVLLGESGSWVFIGDRCAADVKAPLGL